jgi:hypothetical protein
MTFERIHQLLLSKGFYTQQLSLPHVPIKLYTLRDRGIDIYVYGKTADWEIFRNALKLTQSYDADHGKLIAELDRLDVWPVSNQTPTPE